MVRRIGRIDDVLAFIVKQGRAFASEANTLTPTRTLNFSCPNPDPPAYEVAALSALQTCSPQCFLVGGPVGRTQEITGFVIQRSRDDLPDRQREDLVKVDRASGHLLEMINDLLDLTEVGAVRMDVNPERFSVPMLMANSLDTVSPLVKTNVEIRQEVDPDVGEALSDAI